MYYPLLFQPNLHPVIWGGKRICEYKHLPAEQQPVGESWEVSAVPSSTSIVANGPFAGRLLTDVIAEGGEDILGRSVFRQYHGELPLLAKFIDANRDLSIQVHPDDAMAQRLYGKMGKSEMWYIIDAHPGSYLYAGFSRTITPEEYRQHIQQGTITSVLARHAVHPGDVFYLPAGRVHAIGAGILLAEIQQSSDITYRIYDYDRPGMDGRPRELHTELAAQALDYHVERDYRTTYTSRVNRANLVLDTTYFTVRVTEITAPFHRNLIKYDSFVICMCISGDCRLRVRPTGHVIHLPQGHSTLIPAAIADYDLLPIGPHTKTLETFINNQSPSFLSRFLHIEQ